MVDGGQGTTATGQEGWRGNGTSQGVMTGGGGDVTTGQDRWRGGCYNRSGQVEGRMSQQVRTGGGDVTTGQDRWRGITGHKIRL